MDRASTLIIELVKCAFMFQFAAFGLLGTEYVAQSWKSWFDFLDSLLHTRNSWSIEAYRIAARIIGAITAVLGTWTLAHAIFIFATTKS